MNYVPLIPERLTYAETAPGERYEVWRTPQGRSRFQVVFFRQGVAVNQHYYNDLISARKNFERMVEEKIR